MLQSLLVLVEVLSSPASGSALLIFAIGALVLAVTALVITTMILTVAVIVLMERRAGQDVALAA